MLFPLQRGTSPVTALRCEHDAYPKFDTRPASMRPWLGRLIKPANFQQKHSCRLWHSPFCTAFLSFPTGRLNQQNLLLFLAPGSKTAARIIAKTNPAEDQY